MSVGPTALLDLGATPRSEAAQELAALLVRGHALRDRVGELDREQREANERAAAASAALAEVERRRLAGDDVGAQRKKFEAELAKAKGAAAEPWAERRAGGQQAVRDHEREAVAFVAENFAALYGELAEDAEAAATRVDHACNELIAAYHERQLVEGRVTELAAMIRHPQPGDVTRTCAEAVAAAASALLQSGGEQPPLLRSDPVTPRHGELAEAEPDPVATA